MKRVICVFTFIYIIMMGMSAKITLRHIGQRAQIEIDNQPMLILGAELSNSAATSIADINEVLPRMKAIGINTVLIPAQWDLIEAEEGKMDFSLIDAAIMKARECDLKLIFLWFGAWKNSMSCYAPMWFKEDVKRFPRAITQQGKPLEIASAFSENVFQADNRAFSSLIQHIKEIDQANQTVIMVQVENEIGMLESARDYSPEAEKAYRSPIPKEVRKVLKKDKAISWNEAFGKDLYGEERFMAYYYARYVERLAQSARKIYDIPLYVNAAMNSRGRKPGEYPSAGPLAHLADIWQLAAPSIDILAPDIYDTGFKGWARQYDMGTKNPLFIPESRCCENSGVRALYTFGEHEGVGFSPFAVDQCSEKEARELARSYTLLHELQPILLKYRGKNAIRGLLFDQEDKETLIEDGDMTLTCRHYFTLPWDSRATDGSTWHEGGAIIIRLAKNDYIVAGSGVVIVFQKTTEKKQEEAKVLGEDGFADNGNEQKNNSTLSPFKGKRMGIGTVDQVSINSDGTMQYIRRENGDQDHQGRHVRISIDDYKILHVKLYEYGND